MVTGEMQGNTTLFFIVSQNGVELSKDYAILSVGNDTMSDNPPIVTPEGL